MSLVLGIGWLLACSDGLPPGEPVQDWRAPTVRDSSGVRLVGNHGPRVQMTPGSGAPPERLHLLFVDGRAATQLADGRFGWADLGGARGIVFDRSASVETVLQGAPPEGPPPNRPAFVVDGPDGWRLVETDGRVLRFDASTPVAWTEGLGQGVLAARVEGRDLAVRTVLEFDMRPVRSNDPLVWTSAASGLGEAHPPEEPLLGQLHNSGWVVPLGGGRTAFAAATRPEVRLLDARGRTMWISTFTVEAPAQALRFELVEGTLHPRFRAVIHGLAAGPRGRLFALVDSDGLEGAEHVLAFDQNGVLVADATVTPDQAIAVGPGQTLWTLDVPALLARTPESAARATFPDFEWPVLGGAHTLGLADIEEPIMVVNMWASWCAPCRRELPLLATYALSPEADDVAVIGFNDDLRLPAALAFLEEVGGIPFPSVAGAGAFRRAYGYRGLPYTVVLDSDRRVVGSVYGFGSSIDPIRELVEQARSGLRTEDERGAP